MKFCSRCGAEIEDDVKFCPHCGCAIENETVEKTNHNRGLTTAAEVLMVINTVAAIVGAIAHLAFAFIGLFGGFYLYGDFYPEYQAYIEKIGSITMENFNNVVCVALAVYFFVNILWLIPMTLYVHKARKFDKTISTAFKVWTFFLVGFIPAILLFCRKEAN